MRLRYLQLPRCGPLTDVAVVFGREDLVSRVLNLTRQGALNFVVGVNGSGKSSILRVIYEAFTALRSGRFPRQPLALAWDLQQSNETMTAMLLIPDGAAPPVFATSGQIPLNMNEPGWRNLMLMQDFPDAVHGSDVLGGMLQAFLPKRLVAYTSGATELWAHLEHPDFHPDESVEDGDHRSEDERPQGWSLSREWDEEQPLRVTNLLTQFSGKSGTPVLASDGSSTPLKELPAEVSRQLVEELRPLAALGSKMAVNLTPREARLDQTYFRVAIPQLRHAAVVLALLQAAKELAGRTQQEEQDKLRRLFLANASQKVRSGDARDLLNRIDWFWPTHLSLVYFDAKDRVSPRQHRELLCLVALAEEVVEQPRGRMRSVIHLGPKEGIQITPALESVFGKDMLPEWAKQVAQRVDNVKTGAEAVLRILSEDTRLDSTPLDAFTRLRDWESTGLLEEITLTVKRLSRPNEDDTLEADRIVLLDQMSDGEQVLLGRMGLLYLLRGQDGSLLLLDEPETHFNDVWKREMVEMMDAGLLDSTHASVLVATHTSIALTDAFAAEVTVLDQGRARTVRGGLFGTDPGEVTMSLFGADGTTGSRAAEILDRLLKTEWRGREVELEQVLGVLGSSFHRAELRAVLKELKASDDGTA